LGGEIKLIDFGSACTENRTVYSYIQSRFYRSPEVVLGHAYSTAIDLWSLGCVAAELFLGLPLFPGASEFDMLHRMVETMGCQPPDAMLRRAKHTAKYFVRTADGGGGGEDGRGSAYRLKTVEEVVAAGEARPALGKRYFRQTALSDLVLGYALRRGEGAEEARQERASRVAFVDFLSGLLHMDPAQRWTARQVSDPNPAPPPPCALLSSLLPLPPFSLFCSHFLPSPSFSKYHLPSPSFSKYHLPSPSFSKYHLPSPSFSKYHLLSTPHGSLRRPWLLAGGTTPIHHGRALGGALPATAPVALLDCVLQLTAVFNTSIRPCVSPPLQPAPQQQQADATEGAQLQPLHREGASRLAQQQQQQQHARVLQHRRSLGGQEAGRGGALEGGIMAGSLGGAGGVGAALPPAMALSGPAPAAMPTALAPAALAMGAGMGAGMGASMGAGMGEGGYGSMGGYGVPLGLPHNYGPLGASVGSYGSIGSLGNSFGAMGGLGGMGSVGGMGGMGGMGAMGGMAGVGSLGGAGSLTDPTGSYMAYAAHLAAAGHKTDLGSGSFGAAAGGGGGLGLGLGLGFGQSPDTRQLLPALASMNQAAQWQMGQLGQPGLANQAGQFTPPSHSRHFPSSHSHQHQLQHQQQRGGRQGHLQVRVSEPTTPSSPTTSSPHFSPSSLHPDFSSPLARGSVGQASSLGPSGSTHTIAHNPGGGLPSPAARGLVGAGAGGMGLSVGRGGAEGGIALEKAAVMGQFQRRQSEARAQGGVVEVGSARASMQGGAQLPRSWDAADGDGGGGGVEGVAGVSLGLGLGLGSHYSSNGSTAAGAASEGHEGRGGEVGGGGGGGGGGVGWERGKTSSAGEGDGPAEWDPAAYAQPAPTTAAAVPAAMAAGGLSGAAAPGGHGGVAGGRGSGGSLGAMDCSPLAAAAAFMWSRPSATATAPVAWGGGSLVDGRAAFSADGQRLLCPCGAVVRVFALASATQVRIPPPKCSPRARGAPRACGAINPEPTQLTRHCVSEAVPTAVPMPHARRPPPRLKPSTPPSPQPLPLPPRQVAVLQGHTALVTCVSTSAAARLPPAATVAAAQGADDDDDHMGINPPADVSAPDSTTSSMVFALRFPRHPYPSASPLPSPLPRVPSALIPFPLVSPHPPPASSPRPRIEQVMYPYASTEVVEGAGGREERAVPPVALVVVGNAERGCDVLQYDVFHDRCRKTLFHQMLVSSPLAISPATGRLLAVASGRKVFVAPFTRPAHHARLHLHHRRALTCVAIHPDDQQVAAGDVLGRVVLWHGIGRRSGGAEGEEDCEAVSSLHWHAQPVADLAFSPDGLHLVSIGAEAVALIWQLQSGARRFLPRMPAALLRLVLPPSLLPSLPPPSPSAPSAAAAEGAAAGGAGGARSLVAPAAAPEALRFGMQCADNSVRVVDLSESSLIPSIRGIAPPPPTRPLPARHFILPPLDPFKAPLGPLPSSASATSSSLSNCLPADVARQLAVELAVTGGGAPSAVVQSVRGGSARLVVVGPLGVVQVYDVGRQQVVAQVHLMRINVVSSAEVRYKKALKAQEMQQRDHALRLLQGGQGKPQQPQPPQQQGPKPPPIWVSHVCFSPDGHTLVTVEIRQPEDLAGQQSTLKFWAAPFGGTQGVRQGSGKGGKSSKEGLTALTTAVDAPHGAAGLVTGVHVRAGGDMVVTCGTDGEFRTWTRVWGEEEEDQGGGEGERKGGKQGLGGVKGGGGRGRGGVQGSGQAKTARERMEEREAGIAPLTFCWRCRAVGSYASQPLLAACFSWEGSLLAVAALHRVTLWDPDRHALLAVLQCAPSLSPLQAGVPWHQPVTALAFLPHSPFLLTVSGALAPSGTFFAPPGSTAAPYAALSVWSLLSLSLAWCLHLRVLSLATHPSAPLFAVIVAAPTAGSGGVRGGDTGQGSGVGKDEEGGAVLVFERGESPVPMAAWEMADVNAATVAFLPPASSSPPAASSKGDAAQWSIVVVSGGREYAVLSGEESPPAPDAADRDGERVNGAAGMADGQALSAFESIYGSATTAAAVAAAAGGLTEQGRAAGEGSGQGEMEAVDGRPWGSLLSAPSHVLPSLSRLSNTAAMLQHCRAEHGGFDLRQLRAAQQWDEYQCIRAVNFIRTQVAAHRCIHCLQSFPSLPHLIQHMEASQHFLLPPLPLSAPSEPSSPPPWGDDAYLRSFLEGDPVLYSLDDDDDTDVGEGPAKDGSGAAAGAGAAREASDVVDVTGLPLTAAAGAAAAAAAAEGDGVGSSEDERALAFQELLSLAQGEGGVGEQGEGEGAGAESSEGGGAGVHAASKGGMGGGIGSSGIPSGGTSGGSVGKGKEKVGEVTGARREDWGADGEDEAPSLEQYVALANQVLLLRQQNAQLAHQLAATSAGRAAEGLLSAAPSCAAAAVPRTPFSTPMVSPSPSTASLLATATAAAAIASAAAQASGASNSTDGSTSEGGAAGAGAGPAAPSAAAAAWQAHNAAAPRTPFSTPLVSPCPSYASLATAAAAAAAAAGVGESGAGGAMHEGSVKDMLLHVTAQQQQQQQQHQHQQQQQQQQQQHKQGRPPIPLSPRPASSGASGEKTVGLEAAKAGFTGGEGTGVVGLEGGGTGTGSPVVPRTPFSTPLASPSPSYALLPLDEAQRKLAAVAEAVDVATDLDAPMPPPAPASAAAGAGAGGKEEGGGEEGQAVQRKRRQVTFGAVQERLMRVIDASYFSSYAGFGIHREMLSDKARTTAYQAALEENPSLIEGATVLDVGCGTGILSLFAARGGAARVVAVDGSREILAVAQQIARANGYLAGATSTCPPPCTTSASAGQRAPRPVVSFVCGKIEDLSPAPTETTQAHAQTGAGGEGAGGGGGRVEVALERGSVDVIVSEWMGYALLYESMLPSVLHARDTWLKPGGALLPDTASMHVAGIGEGATSVGFWRDVYGFTMASVAREIQDDAARTPLVQEVKACDIVTSTCTIKHFDLCTVTVPDLDFTSDFQITPALPTSSAAAPPADSPPAAAPTAPSPASPVLCYGLALWFDTGFSSRFCSAKPVLLSTSPFCTPTHWAQTLLTFREPIALAPPAESTAAVPTGEAPPLGAAATGAGGAVGSEGRPAVEVRGRVSVVRGSKHRSIDISVEVVAVSADGGDKAWPAQIAEPKITLPRIQILGTSSFAFLDPLSPASYLVPLGPSAAVAPRCSPSASHKTPALADRLSSSASFVPPSRQPRLRLPANRPSARVSQQRHAPAAPRASVQTVEAAQLPQTWSAFSAAITGEWAGYSSDFCPDGIETEIPREAIPPPFCDWGLALFAWQAHSSTNADASTGEVQTVSERFLPSLGFGGGGGAASRYSVDRRAAGIGQDAAGVLGFRDDGCYAVAWPGKSVSESASEPGVNAAYVVVRQGSGSGDASQFFELEHCLVAENADAQADGKPERVRVRVVQRFQKGAGAAGGVGDEGHLPQLLGMTLFRERWVGEWRAEPDGVNESSEFAEGPPVGIDAVEGRWLASAMRADLKLGDEYGRRGAVVELKPAGTEEVTRELTDEGSVLLPQGVWSRVLPTPSGGVILKAGWLVEADKAIVSRFDYSALGRLEHITISTETRISKRP
ncbi:unnamed protein product, partial [Closterium sp. Yama58-4]